MDEALQIPGLQVNQSIINAERKFKEKLESAKESTKKELRNKFEQRKIDIILNRITEEKIEFTFNGTTIKDLKKEIKEKLTGIDYNRAMHYVESTEREINNLVVNLENGSKTAFNEFTNKTTSVINNIFKASVITLANRTALFLAPTMGVKIAIFGAMAGIGTYKLIKNNKYKKVISRESRCNKVLEKLELSFDNNGKVIDTRFNENAQEIIRTFLKEKKINYIDTGYLSLREQIYKLEYNQKVELANRINNTLGNKINIEKELKNTKENFFEKLKRTQKRITLTTTTATMAAVGINSIDPAITAGPINAILSTTLIKRITNSKLIQNITGISTLIGTKLLEYIPVLGKEFKKILAIENLGLFAMGGIGVGIISSASIEIAKTIKNMLNMYKNRKDREKIYKLDFEKYQNENIEEYKKMEAMTKGNASLEEQAIIDLVVNFSQENNIYLPLSIKNIKDLKKEIEQLNNNERKKVQKYLSTLEEYNKNHHSEFVNIISKCGKVALSASLVGLAGLSIYDIITGGAFLNAIKSSLFPDELITTIHQHPSGYTFGGEGRKF